MTSADIVILMAPFAVLFVGMILALGVVHYNDVKGR
jgi:hypothetical protein